MKERRVERKGKGEEKEDRRTGKIKWGLPPPTRGIGLLTSGIIYHSVV